MASLSDFILNQVKSAASGNDLDNNVLGGLSDSILNSLKQKRLPLMEFLKSQNFFLVNHRPLPVRLLNWHLRSLLPT